MKSRRKGNQPAQGDNTGQKSTHGQDSDREKYSTRETEVLMCDLEERVKELTCIHDISKVVHYANSLEDAFQKTVKLIPFGWYYSDITHARICYGGDEYVEESFEETQWKQASDIVVDDQRCGCLEVFYLSERPTLDEGPFLTEERHLIDAIACVLSESIEHRNAQQALQASERELKEAQEIAQMGHWKLDLETNVLTWSDEVYRIFGLVPQQFGASYKAFLEIVHPADREMVDQAYTKSLQADEMPYDIVHRILLKDGTVKSVHEKCRTEYNDQGKALRSMGTLQDVTKTKLSEQKLQRLNRTLESKNAEMQDIVYIASHDLRSPLVNIQGFAGRLAQACGELKELLHADRKGSKHEEQIQCLLEEDIPEALYFIRMGADKMDSLVDGLLRLSRVGSTMVDIKPLETGSMISNILHTMRFQIQNADVDVSVDQLLPTCLGDRTLLDQIFSNLIDNALKYLEPGRKGSLRITGKVEDGMSIYSISDNGIGISAEYQEKIFKVFLRLNPDDKKSGEGLGLTIVTRILNRIDGKITVESQPGEGTTFHVSLPCC